MLRFRNQWGTNEKQHQKQVGLGVFLCKSSAAAWQKKFMEKRVPYVGSAMMPPTHVMHDEILLRRTKQMNEFWLMKCTQWICHGFVFTRLGTFALQQFTWNHVHSCPRSVAERSRGQSCRTCTSSDGNARSHVMWHLFLFLWPSPFYWSSDHFAHPGQMPF